MSPFEINTLKFFSSEHYGICDIQSNFQHIFRVWGAWPNIPPGAVPVWTPLVTVTEPTLLSPSETNSWLRHCCHRQTDGIGLANDGTMAKEAYIGRHYTSHASYSRLKFNIVTA